MTERKSRPGEKAALPKSTAADASQSTALVSQDAGDRAEQKLIADAREHGYRLAVRCTQCGQWVVAAKSVAAHMGPRCRARIGGGRNA